MGILEKIRKTVPEILTFHIKNECDGGYKKKTDLRIID